MALTGELSGHDRTAYDAALAGKDILSHDNATQAGRIPPGESCYVHPAGIRGLYGPTESFFARLKEEMPEPIPAVKTQFSMAMGDAAPSASPVPNPFDLRNMN